MLKSYLENTGGNMATIFAVSIFVILAGVGAAVDIGQMQSRHSDYQNYADMAVLAAASSGEQELAALNSIAKDVVDGNNFSGKTIETKLTVLENNYLHVEVTSSYQMIFMSAFGQGDKTIIASAEAPPKGGLGKVNMALVLDVTESMSGPKIDALKTAADKLVDDLGQGSASGDLMFSVVPFATFVELPTSLAGQPWLELQPAGEDCWNVLDEANSVNCRQMGSGEDAYTECDSYAYTEVCEFREWEGCMGSRAEPWNGRARYGVSQLQGFTSDDWCHSTMLPLTSNLANVKANISSLSTGQDTYIPAGLVWGWRSLMPEAPLTEANVADQNERANVLLLMTDGENSRSLGGTSGTFNGTYHWESEINKADQLTRTLCSRIKGSEIIVYTIAFEVVDAATKNLLRNCASDASKFFDASNTAQLNAAFDGIGTDLARVRLSK